jgi:hypothetical protein
MSLADEIAVALNRNSAENGSDTPDFILAEALVKVLAVIDETINARGRWYGHSCVPASCDHRSEDEIRSVIAQEIRDVAKGVEEGRFTTRPLRPGAEYPTDFANDFEWAAMVAGGANG